MGDNTSAVEDGAATDNPDHPLPPASSILNSDTHGGRDIIANAIKAANTARDKLAALSGSYPDLVKVLIDGMQAESDVNAAAIGILDDQILGVDIQAGTGVARVMADLWDGMSRDGLNGGGNAFSTLAVGGLGLGLGLLLSSRGRRGHHSF